jgi:hypothetical protein
MPAQNPAAIDIIEMGRLRRQDHAAQKQRKGRGRIVSPGVRAFFPFPNFSSPFLTLSGESSRGFIHTHFFRLRSPGG